MVTALVVARRSELDEPVTVSAAAAATGGGGLDLSPGDRHTVRDLLYALLLSSSNDAAVALAEHTSGTEPRFVEIMNRVASRLGAARTHFVTAHGLDAAGHYSTARDLVTIARSLLAHPLLADIVETPSRVIPGPGGSVLVENRNVLLETYKGAIGVKTGFTAEAGEVLVAAARRHGRTVIAVALGSEDAAADCRRLLDYGWARLRRAVLLRAGARVGSVVLDPAGSVALGAAETVRGPDDPTRLEISLQMRVGLPREIAPGDRLGRVTLAAPSGIVGATPAVATGALQGARASSLLPVLGGMLRWGHGAARLVGLS
jgi:serine-type D-Ala-D-Ala carboxypeptidase (penicillin-binding protein 5/6)